MSLAKPTPPFSIVIEWDNARYAELDRTRQMLRNLRSQIAELPAPRRRPEIFFVYDRNTVDGSLVRRLVDEELRPDPALLATHLIATEGLHYYEQKNFGARLSSGDVVVLLDCDIIPEPGWLAAMLDAFMDSEVSVVAGETYIQYSGIYSKAVALFWYFGLRDPAAGLIPTTFFHANNVAFRSEVFAAYPFPNLSAYRIQCTVLCERLRASGIPIHLQKAARAAHPAPLGWYFFTRALNNGRDDVLVAAILERENRPKLRRIYWNYVSCLKRSHQRFAAQGTQVELNALARIAAYGVACAYFSIKAVGALIASLRPSLADRLFPA